jgi:hypothetical protein
VARTDPVCCTASVGRWFRWSPLGSGMLLAGKEEEAIQCQRCQSERFTKEGHDRQGCQVYRCSTCRRRCTEHSASAFAGYRFPPDVIALAVRWYLRYRLGSVKSGSTGG